MNRTKESDRDALLKPELIQCGDGRRREGDRQGAGREIILEKVLDNFVCG